MDNEKLLNMEWEEFCNYAESIGWTPGSPERITETIELMLDNN